MKYIVKGRIIDHDNNDREYVLKGIKLRDKTNAMVVCGGSGYCLEIREGEGAKYILTLVTEETLKGSVAIKTYLSAEAILKNFTYIGDKEV